MKVENIHFIGIGGIGTSSLAQILGEKGHQITGSDKYENDLTKALKKKKYKIFIGHNEENITEKITKIIYSPAIDKENIELRKAQKLKIPCFTYPEALGELTKEYFTIAISGTHGKSTTTAITALVLMEAGFDPTVVLGTKLQQFDNSNYRVGKSKFLIIEACEYKDSFLNFEPNILLINNIEADHLDHFKTEKNYIKTFQKIIDKTKNRGLILMNENDKNSKDLLKKQKENLESFKSVSSKKSTESAYFLNKHVLTDTNSNKTVNIKLEVPGEFNIENAAMAVVIGLELGIAPKTIEKALKKFHGTWRRMENKKTKLKNVKVIDDYGHHPTAVKKTLRAIKEANLKAKILCVFQPHQYSRTISLFKDFQTSFIDADEVIIPNIYEARDSKKDMKKMTTQKLVDAINKYKKTINGLSIENTAKIILERHSEFDIIITMGAGDIYKIYELIQ